MTKDIVRIDPCITCVFYSEDTGECRNPLVENMHIKPNLTFGTGLPSTKDVYIGSDPVPEWCPLQDLLRVLHGKGLFC